MYDRLVVPLDGSDFAEEALAHARELATRLDVPIQLVRSVDPAAMTGIGATLGVGLDYAAVDELIDEEETDAKTYIDSTVATLTGEGFNTTGVVLRGTAAAAIISASQDGDLVVMASHGRSGVRRWFLGSVAEEVVRRSDVPVLLIRLHHAEDH
jgi:nucleotide-binding universal stress UspA family protein